MNNVTVLTSALQQTCSPAQLLWLNEKIAAIKKSEQPIDVLQIALAMAKRKVGDEAIKTPSEFTHWRSHEAARVLLLLAAISTQVQPAKELLANTYVQGDEFEKEAILKALSLLDPTGDLVALAEDSCRTNIITLFTSISQKNPYPAQYFSEGIFNQMILKSLFLDINIEAIMGLRKRVNHSMSRMCFDYVRERLAASRSVPASIWLTIDLTLQPEAIATFKQFIWDENDQHRFYIAQSLSWQSVCPALVDDVTRKIANETNPDILTLLNIVATKTATTNHDQVL